MPVTACLGGRPSACQGGRGQCGVRVGIAWDEEGGAEPTWGSGDSAGLVGRGERGEMERESPTSLPPAQPL